MATREQIYSALFTLVSNSSGFITKSRKVRNWSEVQPSDMPAIFQAQTGENFQQTGSGVPAKRIFNAELYVYAYSPNNSDTPATQLNSLLDAVETALAPDFSGKQTLGGLVSHCWIEGQIATDEGTLGQTAVAIIPIRILATI